LDRKRRPEALAKLHRSLKVTRPYILVQATRGLKAFARLLAKHRARFAGYQLVALPLGPAVGDDVAILKSDLSNLVELPGYPHPLHVAELIGGAAGVVGISLHLAITAIALGVPVFRPAFAFEGKYSVLTEYTNVHAFEADGEIDPAWFEAKLAQHGWARK
jgi:lipopolysaccharide transport system ATP-binding protein